MILFNDLSLQYQQIKTELENAVREVLESGWYILGTELESFEQEFANYIGVKYCIGVGSGTDALTLSLMALEIGEGDEVITSNLTAYPTITGITRAGAIPVVAEISANDGLIDPSCIENKITSRTKAILPVHLYGQSCNMNKILSIAKKHHISIIEDCAQSIGSTYENRKTGSFGQCAAFSFYPTKNLGAFGDAGAVVTNDEHLNQQLRLLRNYGQSGRYHHEIPGMNSRMDELQAAILNVKLKYIDEWNLDRARSVKMYRENLVNVNFLDQHLYGVSNNHIFAVKSNRRDDLMQYLKTNSVQSFIHYPSPVNMQKAFIPKSDEEPGVSNAFSNQILSLPLYPGIDKHSINQIIQIINEFKN